MPDDFYFPTYIGLLSPEHRERIGPALWEFLWFISKTTKEFQKGEEKMGIVLGGKPIKYSEVANDLGVSESTAKRNIIRLKEFQYIESKRAPYGEIYTVRNSKKFKSKRKVKNDLSENRDRSHMTERKTTYDLSNKDIKDIKRKIEGEKDVNHLQNENRKLITNKYIQRRGYGFDVSPVDELAIDRLLKDNIPIDKILLWIDEVFDEYQPKHRLDEIKSFKYLEVSILDRWAKEQAPKVKTGKHKKHNEIDWENL